MITILNNFNIENSPTISRLDNFDNFDIKNPSFKKIHLCKKCSRSFSIIGFCNFGDQITRCFGCENKATMECWINIQSFRNEKISLILNNI